MLAKIKAKKEEFKAKNPKKYWTFRIIGIVIMLHIFIFLHAKEIEKGVVEYRKAENNEKLIQLIGDQLKDEIVENGEALLRLIGIHEMKGEE